MRPSPLSSSRTFHRPRKDAFPIAAIPSPPPAAGTCQPPLCVWICLFWTLHTHVPSVCRRGAVTRLSAPATPAHGRQLERGFRPGAAPCSLPWQQSKRPGALTCCHLCCPSVSSTAPTAPFCGDGGLGRSWRTFPGKGQIVSALGFVGQVVPCLSACRPCAGLRGHSSEQGHHRPGPPGTLHALVEQKARANSRQSLQGSTSFQENTRLASGKAALRR